MSEVVTLSLVFEIFHKGKVVKHHFPNTTNTKITIENMDDIQMLYHMSGCDIEECLRGIDKNTKKFFPSLGKPNDIRDFSVGLRSSRSSSKNFLFGSKWGRVQRFYRLYEHLCRMKMGQLLGIKRKSPQSSTWDNENLTYSYDFEIQHSVHDVSGGLQKKQHQEDKTTDT